MADYVLETTQLATTPGSVTAGASAPVTFPVVETVSNLDPSFLFKWRKALARARNGGGRAKILHWGESTSLGYGSGTGTPATINGRAGAAGTRLASILSGLGVPSHQDGFFGWTLGSGGTDARLGIGAGWTTASGAAGIAGPTTNNSTTTNALTFTPTGSVNTFDVWYAGSAGTATIALSIDGGAATNVDTSVGGSNFSKATVTAGSVGAHTLSIARTGTGGSAFIVGIDAYDSTASKVSNVIAGYSGGKANDLMNNNATGQPWYPLNAVPTYAPDITFINVGLNDAIAGTSASTYSADLQRCITAAKTTGDVILVSPHLIDTASATLANQQAIKGAIASLAILNRCPLLDMQKRFVDYTTANAAGLMSDSVHPNALGYWDFAQTFAGVLTR